VSKRKLRRKFEEVNQKYLANDYQDNFVEVSVLELDA
jgi:hypothetical protein